MLFPATCLATLNIGSTVYRPQDRAQAQAVDVASSFSKQLDVAYGPIISLATFVKYDSDYNRAYSMFNATVEDLAKRVGPTGSSC